MKKLLFGIVAIIPLLAIGQTPPQRQAFTTNSASVVSNIVRQIASVGWIIAKDHVSLAAALASAGGTNATVLVSSPLTMSSDVVVPTNILLMVSRGGCITNGGYALTIDGKFEAGRYQVFSGVGGVSFAAGASDRVYPEWWQDNAVPGTTDMTTALQSALNVASPDSPPVVLAPITYRTTNEITVPHSGIIMSDGYGGANTNRLATILGVHSGRSVLSLAGADNVTLRGITVRGDSTTIPNMILLLGRTSSGSFGWHHIENINIMGSCSNAAIYSIASEQNHFSGIFMQVTAKYGFYTSQGDDLAAGGLTASSNIQLVFDGASHLQLSSTDPNSAVLYIGGGTATRHHAYRDLYLCPGDGSYITIKTGTDNGNPSSLVFENLGGENSPGQHATNGIVFISDASSGLENSSFKNILLYGELYGFYTAQADIFLGSCDIQAWSPKPSIFPILTNCNVTMSGGGAVSNKPPGYANNISTKGLLSFGSLTYSNDVFGVGTYFARASFHVTNTALNTQPFRVDAGSSTSALVVDTNGNVAIGGTVNPVAELDITEAGATLGLGLRISGPGPVTGLELNNGGASGGRYALWATASGAGAGADKLALYDYGSASFAWVWDTIAGGFGIGTTTPVAKLDVNGSIKTLLTNTPLATDGNGIIVAGGSSATNVFPITVTTLIGTNGSNAGGLTRGLVYNTNGAGAGYTALEWHTAAGTTVDYFYQDANGLRFKASGTDLVIEDGLKIVDLSGTGTRFVTADPDGVLGATGVFTGDGSGLTNLVSVIKAGTTNITALTAFTVVFSSAFPTTNYTALAIGNGFALAAPYAANKTTTSVTFNFGVATGLIDWQAVMQTQ